MSATRLTRFPLSPGRVVRYGLAVLMTLYLATAVWHVYKPLPDGVSTAAPLRAADRVAWLADTTWVDASGQRRTEQAIFDETFRLIGQARRTIVADMFLYNDFQGAVVEQHRPLAEQLTRALLERKQAVPDIRILVITDPINTLYGGLRSDQLDRLRAAGIDVIITDLKLLRDSNPSWTAWWRICCQWFGNNPGGGWLASPMSDDRITLRSYLAVLNFKANHRKTLIVDEGDTWTGLVTSANPHDASSAHGNAALRFSGPAVLDLLDSELAAARMSGHTTDLPRPPIPATPDSEARIQVLTEGAIRRALLATIDNANPGDRLYVAVFYFSHRELIEALLAARERGVDIRVILDPNKDAFGREKSGVPNRQVASELHAAGIPVRWCNTHGEQCHTKMLLKLDDNGRAELIQGSANFSRRNLDNFNLETDVRLAGPADHPAIADAASLFEARWNNRDGRRFTVGYPEYADSNPVLYLRYRFMEWSGWSTF